MWHLIKKDIKLCRVGIFFLLVLHFFLGPLGLVVVALLGGDSSYTIFLLLLFLYMGFSLTVGVSIGRENKVKGETILYSLPIDRDTIVTARYISAAGFPLVQGITYLLYSYIAKWSGGFRWLGISLEGPIEVINIFNLMGALAIVFLGLSLFLYYSYSNKEKDKKKIKFIGIFTYSFLIIIPGFIVRYSLELGQLKIVEILASLNREISLSLLFLLSIFIYRASWKKSQKNLAESVGRT